jgi:hypothetical protein
MIDLMLVFPDPLFPINSTFFFMAVFGITRRDRRGLGLRARPSCSTEGESGRGLRRLGYGSHRGAAVQRGGQERELRAGEAAVGLPLPQR